jgi:hypothetical protein
VAPVIGMPSTVSATSSQTAPSSRYDARGIRGSNATSSCSAWSFAARCTAASPANSVELPASL